MSVPKIFILSRKKISSTSPTILEKNFAPIFKNAISTIKSIENKCGTDYIGTVVTYVLEASEIDRQDFVDAITAGLSTTNRRKLMTLAEQFRQEGYQQGLTLAEKFKQEALNTVAIKLFNQVLNIEQIDAITGLAPKKIKLLKK